MIPEESSEKEQRKTQWQVTKEAQMTEAVLCSKQWGFLVAAIHGGGSDQCEATVTPSRNSSSTDSGKI